MLAVIIARDKKEKPANSRLLSDGGAPTTTNWIHYVLCKTFCSCVSIVWVWVSGSAVCCLSFSNWFTFFNSQPDPLWAAGTFWKGLCRVLWKRDKLMGNAVKSCQIITKSRNLTFMFVDCLYFVFLSLKHDSSTFLDTLMRRVFLLRHFVPFLIVILRQSCQRALQYHNLYALRWPSWISRSDGILESSIGLRERKCQKSKVLLFCCILTYAH